VLARIPNAQTTNSSIDAQSFEVGESDNFDEEIALTRQNSALMEFLDERAVYKKPGSDTALEDVRRRLG
jgi:hypothetical protein